MSVRKSLMWTYGSQLAAFVISFSTSVVIARLLSPRDMGVFAMAWAVSGLISSFTTVNILNYVIREKEMPREILRAGYTVNAVMAILLAILVTGISFIPGLFEPDVREVLRVTALNPLVGMFEFAPWSMTMREGRFGLYASIAMLRNIAGSLTTVAFVYAGFGAISFAFGMLIGCVASVLAYFVKRPKDMILLPTFRGLRPIFTFGIQMMSIAGAAQLASRLSDFVLGKFLGLAALGLYARASNLSYQISNNVYGLASNVLFSKMSDELRTTGSLHRIYIRSLAILTAIIWPLAIGIAVLARPFIAYVYGEKWLGAAGPLCLLMVAQVVTLGFGMSWELFVLRKETAKQTRFEIIRAIVGTAAFAAGAAFSITAAAVGRVVEALFGYILYRPHMDRLAGASPGELERVYLRSAALTVAAVAPSLLLMLSTGWSPKTSVIQMVIAVATGGVLWLATLAYQRHPLFEEISRVLFQYRRAAAVLKR